MACYKKFENQNNTFIEQNIFNDGELTSYESHYEINGQLKTSVLYYYEDIDKTRYYSLGLRESLNNEQVKIIADDLTEIFKYKTAKTRRKYIFKLIKDNEKIIQSKEEN